LKKDEGLWTTGGFLPSCSGEIHVAASRAFGCAELMDGQWIHVIFTVDRFNMLIKAEFRVVNDVEELLCRSDAPYEGRMLEDANASADELVKFAEASIGTHRDDDGDGGKI